MQIYLDNSATTKIDPRVLEKMLPYFDEEYGNASSIHKLGNNAHKALEKSKDLVSETLNCDRKNIYLTSGATESNNMILKGVANYYKDKGNTILISQIEHPSILETAKFLGKKGFQIKEIPVDENGLIKMNEFKSLLTPNVILVSVLTVNNEIGAIQDIKGLCGLTHKADSLFHTDAVQAVPYLQLDVKQLSIDFLTLSAHKFYGPKGIGLAIVNKKIEPLIHGGSQEEGIRPGTYNIPGIVGLCEALHLAYTEKEVHIEHIKKLGTHMWNRISTEIEDIKLNGNLGNKTPNIFNICFTNIEGEAILIDLSSKGIFVSTGSACSAQTLKASHVLQAIGLKDELLNSNIRFSIGKFNTLEEIDIAIDKLKDTVTRLRKISPIKN